MNCQELAHSWSLFWRLLHLSSRSIPTTLCWFSGIVVSASATVADSIVFAIRDKMRRGRRLVFLTSRTGAVALGFANTRTRTVKLTEGRVTFVILSV